MIVTKKLKTLEEHNRDAYITCSGRLELNGIECPQCKEELVDSNKHEVLLTLPLQKYIQCLRCDFKGVRYV